MSSASSCEASSLSTALVIQTNNVDSSALVVGDMSDASNEMSDAAATCSSSAVGHHQSKKAVGLAVGVDVGDNETPPTSTSSSQANTPSSQSNSAKKRGLSEVIRQLRSQKSEHDEETDDKAGDSRSLRDQKEDENESDGSHDDDEDGHDSASYEEEDDEFTGGNGDSDQHSNHSTKKHSKSKKKPATSPTNSFMTPSSLDSLNMATAAKSSNSSLLKISNSSQGSRGAKSTNATDAVSTGSSANSNSALSNDAHMISAADHLSAIINVVATKDLSPPPLGHSMRSVHDSSKATATSTGGNLADLKNLLERANLAQYLNSFTEQGGDDINQLCEADESEFKEICDLVGMTSKPLHVKRLRKALDEYKSAVRAPQQYNYLNLFGGGSSSSKHDPTHKNCLDGLDANSSQHESEQKASDGVSDHLPDSTGKGSHIFKMLQTILAANNANFPTPSASSTSFSSSSSTSSAVSSSNENELFSNANAQAATSLAPNTTESCRSSTLSPAAYPATVSPNQSSLILAAACNQNPNLFPFYHLLQNTTSKAATVDPVLPTTSTTTPTPNNNSQFASKTSGPTVEAISKGIGEGEVNSQLDQDESQSGQDDMDELGEDDQQLEDDDAEYDEDEDEGEMGGGNGEDEDGEDESSLYNEASSYGGYDEDDDSSGGKGKYGGKKASSQRSGLATPNNLSKVNSSSNAATANFTKPHNEPQNEKTIKKNKVIELYTNGERCVRRLSNLTGVPLTTVYRVIGKLKGINYNIPRGNGAGRKTILDSQDREILVNILNTQPRISRKALGKELEKLTGKSIHNSTLNRELCRLRHHGPSSVAASVLVRGSAASAAALAAARAAEEANKSASHEASKANQLNTEPHANKPVINQKTQSKASVSKQAVSSNSQQVHDSSSSLASRLDQMSQLKELAIKYCARLTEDDCKYNFEHIMPEFMKPIVDYLQLVSPMAPQELRYAKLHSFLPQMLRAVDSNKPMTSDNYEALINEAAIQICLCKAPLVTRPSDLYEHAQKLLEESWTPEPAASTHKRSAKSQAPVSEDLSSRASKRARVDENADSSKAAVANKAPQAAQSSATFLNPLKSLPISSNTLPTTNAPQLNSFSALLHLALIQQQQQQHMLGSSGAADFFGKFDFLSQSHHAVAPNFLPSSNLVNKGKAESTVYSRKSYDYAAAAAHGQEDSSDEC